jgi:UrcA family protein
MFAKKLALSRKSAVLAAALVTFIPALSQADTSVPEAKSVKVSAAGFDLNSEAGARAFYTHVSVAAGSVCNAGMRSDPIYGSQYDACFSSTLKNAIKSLDRPLLTAIFNEKHPREALSINGDSPRLASK